MVELKKLDWTKCKLPNIAKDCNAMFAKAIGDQVQVCITDVTDGHCDVLATRSPLCGDWFTGPHIDERCIESLLNIHEATKVVDAFIAAETARIEAEEDAANWLKIPWQDATWLQGSCASLRVFLFPGSKEPKPVTWNLVEGKLHEVLLEADKRTLPAGYDPEKPRWVNVENSDACRLYNAGCSMAIRGNIYGDDWSPVFNPNGSNKYEYAVDAHTLPPDVPLHEEPKPVPRPCTKEFALSNPDASEARYDGVWKPASYWNYDGPMNKYEFRTTAPAEKKSLVIAEMQLWMGRLDGVMDNGKTYAFDTEFSAAIRKATKSSKNPRLALIVDEES